jgi:hypothetical protein
MKSKKIKSYALVVSNIVWLCIKNPFILPYLMRGQLILTAMAANLSHYQIIYKSS